MQYHPPSWLPASENGKRTDYYAHLRAEVIEAIPEGCAVVLDVGCGKGTLGRWLKEQPGVTTGYGAELFPAAGALPTFMLIQQLTAQHKVQHESYAQALR